MQNSEKRRPLRRPARRREIPEEYSDSQAEEDADLAPGLDLPEHRLRFALIAGATTGIIMALIHLLTPLLNTGAFQKSVVLGEKMGTDTALAVAALTCLSLLLNIAICAVSGYFVGKYAVQRRLGFFSGLLAGVTLYFGIFLISYIPNYPGNAPAPPFSIVYVLPLLILILLFGIVGGLVSLLFTWITTRKHPYYTGAGL
jgi:hypothetical protein